MRRTISTLVFIGLVIVATALRVIGYPSLPAGRTESSPLLYQTVRTESDLQLAEQRVLDFYRRIGDRDFEQAAAEVIELTWVWDSDGFPHAIGLLDHTAFVIGSSKAPELSIDDWGALILRVEAQASREPVSVELPELAALRGLPDGPSVLDAIAVNASGTVRIACTAYDWERQMVVVRVGDDWNLLLPPPAPYARSRVLAWFPQRAGSDKGY